MSLERLAFQEKERISQFLILSQGGAIMWLLFTDWNTMPLVHFGIIVKFSFQTLCFMVTCQLTVKYLSVTFWSFIGHEKIYRKWAGGKHGIYFTIKVRSEILTIVAYISQSDTPPVTIPTNTIVGQEHKNRQEILTVFDSSGIRLVSSFSFSFSNLKFYNLKEIKFMGTED